MWNMIDTMDEPKDYLQVFDLSEENGKQKIVHSQEQPEYMKDLTERYYVSTVLINE